MFLNILVSCWLKCGVKKTNANAKMMEVMYVY